jgi:hypothetical protein
VTLFVHAYGAYASYVEPPWRQADYDIDKLVKVLTHLKCIRRLKILGISPLGRAAVLQVR